MDIRHHVEKCGCRVEIAGGVFHRLVYCKVHKAAPEMHEQITKIKAILAAADVFGSMKKKA